MPEMMLTLQRNGRVLEKIYSMPFSLTYRMGENTVNTFALSGDTVSKESFCFEGIDFIVTQFNNTEVNRCIDAIKSNFIMSVEHNDLKIALYKK